MPLIRDWRADLEKMDGKKLEEVRKAIETLMGWKLFRKAFKDVVYTLADEIGYELDARAKQRREDNLVALANMEVE